MAFVSSVPVPSIDATGCHVPDFTALYAGLVADFRGIYGQDVVLDPSTLDGQWLGILATAFKNYCDSFLACYNAFSPQTAQGVGLSSVVKVNGITRDAASASTVDLLCIGQAGRTVTGGQVRDIDGNLWSLPDFVFPFGGAVTMTATCQTIGAIAAPAGGTSGGSNSYWSIATPQLGWQTVQNLNAATPGAPVESDAQLRIRQAASTMLPALGVLDGIEASILAVPDVARLKVYENDTSVTDVNGIPGHTISVVVDGGDALAICTAIARRKTPGAGTYGNASQIVTNAYGVPRQINYFRPSQPPITVNLTVRALDGYTLDDEAAIKQSVSDWVNALNIGQDVLVKRVYGPALLIGTPSAARFEILSLTIARDQSVTQEADVAIAFNEAAYCLPDYVAIGYVS